MPPEQVKIYPHKKKIPLGYIIGGLALVVVLIAIFIFSMMNRNPLKDMLLPEPAANTVKNNDTQRPALQPNQGVTVDRVDVMTLESFPVQINALVRGNLADSCTRILNASSRKEDDTFIIDFQTARQGDMCAQVLTPFEQSVSLDVTGLKKGTYKVSVAGFTTTFTLSQDNVPDFSSALK